MKAIILCAGYGTRLRRDIDACADEGLKRKLDGVPKPLLPFLDGKKNNNGKETTLLSKWIDIFDTCSTVDGVVVVINEKYRKRFENWMRDYNSKTRLSITLVNDGSTSNETRLGAVACIKLGIEDLRREVDPSFVIVAGDTLFHDDFDLNAIITYSRDKSVVVATCPVLSDEEVSKRGIVEMEDNGSRITKFLEKPDPSETTSRMSCPPFYVIRNPTCFRLIDEFLNERKQDSVDKRDAPGNLIAYLVQKSDVYAFPVSGRHDVGGLHSYLTLAEKMKR